MGSGIAMHERKRGKLENIIDRAILLSIIFSADLSGTYWRRLKSLVD